MLYNCGMSSKYQTVDICGMSDIMVCMWSVTKCEVWSVKWEVRSVKCEGWRAKYEVWSVKCEVWSVKCEVCRVKCEKWSVNVNVWSVKCEVWSVKCECVKWCGMSMKVIKKFNMNGGCGMSRIMSKGCIMNTLCKVCYIIVVCRQNIKLLIYVVCQI